MEAILVDTCVLVDVLRGSPRAIGWWRRAERKHGITVSAVTVAELLAGCRDRAEQRLVQRTLAPLPPVHIEADDSKWALEQYAALRLARGVGFLDCLVAAAAVRLGCALYTLNDKHYRSLPGLRVERPY